MGCGCESNKPKKQRGGMVASPAAFPQGEPWNVETALPGMNGGVANAGNFYKVNPQGGALPDPVSSTNIQGSGASVGGKKRKRRVTKKARKSRKGKGKTRRHRKSKAHKKKARKGKKSRKTRKGRKGRKGRKSYRRKTMRAGGRDTIFQGPVNTYRGMLYGAGDLVNQWSGKPSQLSPAPTDQAPVPSGNVILGEMPDVNAIHVAAGQAVASI
jgi:hypothetical protein